jgi:hypothetical protein
MLVEGKDIWFKKILCRNCIFIIKKYKFALA